MKRKQNNILSNQALKEIFLAALKKIPFLAFFSSRLKRAQSHNGNCGNSLKYFNLKDNHYLISSFLVGSGSKK